MQLFRITGDQTINANNYRRTYVEQTHVCAHGCIRITAETKVENDFPSRFTCPLKPVVYRWKQWGLWRCIGKVHLQRLASPAQPCLAAKFSAWRIVLKVNFTPLFVVPVTVVGRSERLNDSVNSQLMGFCGHPETIVVVLIYVTDSLLTTINCEHT